MPHHLSVDELLGQKLGTLAAGQLVIAVAERFEIGADLVIGIRRAQKGASLHGAPVGPYGSALTKVRMIHVEGHSGCTPGVTRRRLNPDLGEWAFTQQPAVGHAVEG